jgi:hypothetical protein
MLMCVTNNKISGGGGNGRHAIGWFDRLMSSDLK